MNDLHSIQVISWNASCYGQSESLYFDLDQDFFWNGQYYDHNRDDCDCDGCDDDHDENRDENCDEKKERMHGVVALLAFPLLPSPSSIDQTIQIV